MRKLVLLLCGVFLLARCCAQDSTKQLKPQEYFIQLSTGVHMNYVEQGDTLGTPVIFLHGYTDSWHSFETILPFLPNSIHAFVLTQRGHGNSSKPQSNYQPRDFATDVAKFIEMKRLGKVIIVGHSMGGAIVQQFSLDYPQMTKGIVFISTDAAFKDNPGLPEFREEISKLTDPIDYRFAEEFQKGTIAQPVDSAFVRLYIEESLKVPAFIWKAVINGLMTVDYTNELYKIYQPTLILWGDKDTICSKVDQDRMLKGIKNAKLLIYEGTGHALHWEQPERLAKDVADFVQSIQ